MSAMLLLMQTNIFPYQPMNQHVMSQRIVQCQTENTIARISYITPWILMEYRLSYLRHLKHQCLSAKQILAVNV